MDNYNCLLCYSKVKMASSTEDYSGAFTCMYQSVALITVVSQLLTGVINISVISDN